MERKNQFQYSDCSHWNHVLFHLLFNGQNRTRFVQFVVINWLHVHRNGHFHPSAIVSMAEMDCFRAVFQRGIDGFGVSIE